MNSNFQDLFNCFLSVSALIPLVRYEYTHRGGVNVCSSNFSCFTHRTVWFLEEQINISLAFNKVCNLSKHAENVKTYETNLNFKLNGVLNLKSYSQENQSDFLASSQRAQRVLLLEILREYCK